MITFENGYIISNIPSNLLNLLSVCLHRTYTISFENGYEISIIPSDINSERVSMAILYEGTSCSNSDDYMDDDLQNLSLIRVSKIVEEIREFGSSLEGDEIFHSECFHEILND
tara:strand:- start:88 stop:426 length:339 start_codon:yes stop_codon:yes gene_type:complete